MRQSDWLKLMSHYGFDENIDTYTRLKQQYEETHRAYHTVKHLDAVLAELSRVRHMAEDDSAIELALYFHDAIYKLRSQSNEKDSADMAVAFLEENSGSQDLKQTVFSLIMATEHNFMPVANDHKLIVDIDLSILGSPPTQYDEYETAIRNEYKYVPRFMFNRNRIKLLQYFLDRDSIYSHPSFIDTLEIQARQNITCAIANLRGV